jgi:hypothetical protein
MKRNHTARVVLSPQHKEILDSICIKLGQSESETLRVVFLDSAKSINLITAKAHENFKLALHATTYVNPSPLHINASPLGRAYVARKTATST